MRVMIELRRYEMQPVLSTGFGSARCVRLYSRVRRHCTFFGSVFDFILLEFWSLRDAKCGLFAFKSPLVISMGSGVVEALGVRVYTVA